MLKKCLLVVVNDPAFFLSHRLPVALAAMRSGLDVHVATAGGDSVTKIKAHGFEHHVVNLSRSGTNPVKEIKSIFMLWRLFRRIRPSLVHLVTIKPVLYGGLVARVVGIPGMVAAVSGLGSVFVSKKQRFYILRQVVEVLYNLALSHPNSIVIFQNTADMEALVSIGATSEGKTRLIPGSGVDLNQYPALPEPRGTPVITMAARLLREKGVAEFAEAAKLLHKKGLTCEFRLIGDTDPGNPSTMTEDELLQIEKDGYVNLLGFRSDIARQYAESHIVCLPSYYGEGLPKSLVEAAACARAVITTDEPGCRDAVIPGKTGLLVQARNVEELADAIQFLIENPEERRRLGRAGRTLAEEKFSIEKIVSAHMEIYQEIMDAA
jgi:glycosyltransferase involved in cell wall biosynthesis